VAALAARLRPYLRVTPVVEVEGADLGREGVSLFLKLEHLQHAGSFKARGEAWRAGSRGRLASSASSRRRRRH
jgi:threonine dehydratase